jgi:cobalt-zinc-cadmium efflux system outer membrane protein
VTRQGGPPQTDYQLSYPIDWFLFGKRAAAMASAAAAVRVSEADFGDLVRQRVRDASLAFYDFVEARALLALARQDLSDLRQVEAATRKSQAVGGRSVVEVNRSRLDVLRSEQALREAETALTAARAKLRAFLGRKDADPDFEVSADLNAALTYQPLPVEESLALAQDNRPDVKSLNFQIDKAAKDVHNEKAKAFPQVTPLIGYTHQYQFKAIGFPDADSWMVALSMTLPFCDRNQGGIAKARSLVTQNSQNLEAGLVDLRSEVVQVVQEFQAAYATANAVARDQLKVAAEVRDSIRRSYEEAKGRSLLEFLDAQRAYRETHRLYINSRASYWRAVYRYSAALGKQVSQHDEHYLRKSCAPAP